MKTLINATTWLLFSLFSLPLVADEALDAERERLRNMLGIIEATLNEKQFKQLIPLLDDEVVVVFLNGEVARGPDQVKSFFDKTLGNDDAILKDYKTVAKVSGPARFIGNTAIADGTAQDTFIFTDGSEMIVDTLWTVTLERQDNEWKVVQLHFSSHFFKNPLVEAMQTKLMIFSIAGVAVGLIVGYFIRRRRSENV
jgi:ketosteroid isomerase-like protein